MPIQAITERQSKTVDTRGKDFSRMVHSTGQPRTWPGEICGPARPRPEKKQICKFYMAVWALNVNIMAPLVATAGLALSKSPRGKSREL